MSDTACNKSPTGRHKVRYREQARIFTDGNERRSTCHHCGVPIWRAHRTSAWWHSDQDVAGKVVDLMAALKESLKTTNPAGNADGAVKSNKVPND